MSIKRPKATDTEEDLLALQENFFSRGEKPSVLLKKPKVQDVSDSPAQSMGRDVVRLSNKGSGPVKKSKFREERERVIQAKKHAAKQKLESYGAMDSQDKLAVKTAMSMFLLHPTLSHAKDGFPRVPEIDLSSLDSELPPKPRQPDPWGPPMGTRKKKKSLFAQQFGDKDLSFFGIEETPADSVSVALQKDFVEPVRIGGDVVGGGVVGEEGRSGDMGTMEGMSHDLYTRVGTEGDEMRRVSGEKEEEGSDMEHGLPSETTEGVRVELSKSEREKIHKENVEKLSTLSVEEILEEKARIEKVLKPDMVAFLKSRKTKDSLSAGMSTEEQSGIRGNTGMSAEDLGGIHGNTSPSPAMGAGTPAGLSGEHDETSREDPGVFRAQKKMKPPEGMQERDTQGETMDVSTKPGVDRTEARFTFNGLVMPRSATTIPSRLCLHHHEDEPQAPGYTLLELIPLCRSAVLQQRVLSLQLLSRIMRRAWRGEYKPLVEEPVLTQLCEAEVPLLLRYALDEGTEAVVLATIQALHSLVVSILDQDFVREYSLCYCGHQLPALRPPHVMRKKKIREEEEEEEETDSDVLQRDIIEGLLVVNLLPRVRYLLEVYLPPEQVTSHLQLLEILTRVAQHSSAAASQVISCPRLMQVVFEKYLPLTWVNESKKESSTGTQTSSCRPQLAAMELVRALCIAGRGIASQLVSKYNLLSVITCYTVIHPSEQNLPAAEAYPLATASLTVWSVLLSYGLKDEVFRDTFTVFLRQLQQLCSSSPHLSSLEASRVAALLSLVEQVFPLAALHPSQLRLDGGGLLPPPALQWSHAAGLFLPLLHALSAWAREGVASTQPDMDSLVYCGGLLNTVASYLESLQHKVGKECPLEVLEQVEGLVSTLLKMLPESPFFSKTLEAISCDIDVSSSSAPPSLPAHLSPLLPADPQQALYSPDRQQEEEQVGEDLTVKSPPPPSSSKTYSALLKGTNLVLGVVRLCLSCARVHRGVVGGVATWMWTNKLYREYLKTSISGKGELSPLSHLRVKVVHSTIQMFLIWAEMQEESAIEEELITFFHTLSFKLMAVLPEGTADIASALLGDIFHPLFYSKGLGLGSTSGVYRKALGRMLRLQMCSNPLKQNSQLLPPSGLLLPTDWVFYPLILEYDGALNQKTASSANVTQTLAFIVRLEENREVVLSDLSLSTKLARLMCIFFMGDLLFEDKIRLLLEALLKLYCRDSVLSTLDLSLPIPGVQSFTDMYNNFVEHFASVSYGDQLFGTFVLLPLQQRLPVALRRLVWEDYPQILRLLSTPLDKLPFSVDLFLHPPERDAGLVRRYLSCLASSDIRPEWSPLLYLVAVHHVHSFVFSEPASSSTSLQQEMLSGVLGLKNEIVKKDLIQYCGFNNFGVITTQQSQQQ